MKNKIDDTIQSAQTSEAIQSTQTNEKSSSASDLFIDSIKQFYTRATYRNAVQDNYATLPALHKARG
jgi:hypothetical protein